MIFNKKINRIIIYLFLMIYLYFMFLGIQKTKY